jgi:hypothetical protein
LIAVLDLIIVAPNALFVKLMQAEAVPDNENRVFTRAPTDCFDRYSRGFRSDVEVDEFQHTRHAWKR